MAVRYLKKSVTLQGRITAEEAEPLQQWLKSQPRASVNVGKCEHMHAAVLQVLLALRPKVTGTPADPWLQAALAPQAQAPA